MEADSSPCAGVRPGSGDDIASAAARSPATEMGLDFGGVCSRTSVAFFASWPVLPSFSLTDERILRLLAHIEMGQRDGPIGSGSPRWTEYQPVCCLI